MAALPDVDVAIVGGGVGGIYTAWRLLTSELAGPILPKWKKARGKLKVALYEGSDRIGGRLLSVRSPKFPDSTGEMGGMRYVVPTHPLMKGLVEDVFKLDRHKQTVDEDANIAHLRGRQLRMTDLADPARLPYFFNEEEIAWFKSGAGQNTPADLIGKVLKDLIPDLDAHVAAGTLRDYLAGIKVEDVPLSQHGLWNLLAKYLSPDGYAAARALVGYDCLGGNYNALDLTAEYFNFTRTVEYRMVNVGYEAVPWHLRQGFDKAGGEVHLNRWLDSFRGVVLADGSKGVQLHFRDGGVLTARAIVLALPRRAIELLRHQGEVLGEENTHFRELLASVSGIPLFKAFLLYDECWWQDSGVKQGRSLTNLPMRQCYYWPCGPQGTGVPGRKDHGLVMIYDDLLNVSFWGGLDKRGEVHKAGLPLGQHVAHNWPMFEANHPARPRSKDPFADELLKNWTDHPVTQPMVNELHRELKVLHGKDKDDTVPEPVDAAYMDWSRDPYGGGVHFWNVNVNSGEVLEEMTQPVENFPCYICGEAWSTNQTWAEGALQTAEIVLQKRFGLAKAGWQK